MTILTDTMMRLSHGFVMQTSILILGPGEAKGELQKQLEGQALSDRIVRLKHLTA